MFQWLCLTKRLKILHTCTYLGKENHRISKTLNWTGKLKLILKNRTAIAQFLHFDKENMDEIKVSFFKPQKMLLMKNCLPVPWWVSDRHCARMNRCLAIQICEEPSSVQSSVSQQHIPRDQVTVDFIPNRKSVLHYCQLCNIFPILFSFKRSKNVL